MKNFNYFYFWQISYNSFNHYKLITTDNSYTDNFGKGLKKICKWDNINKKCLNADRIYEEGLASFIDKYTSEEYW